MIKIVKTKLTTFECNGCGRLDDVYSVCVGKNESRYVEVRLCPACRKQLSNMLTKRVKE